MVDYIDMLQQKRPLSVKGAAFCYWLKANSFYLAEFIKRSRQILGYHLCGAAFNVVSLDEMYQVSVFKKRNARAAWRVRRHVFSGLRHGILIKTSEYRGDAIGRFAVLHRHLHGWTRISCGTSANGIDENQGGSFGLDGAVHLIWGKQFLYTR
jgi:hypothetical protein